MHTYPNTIIIRHRRENLNKCSLRGLEERADMQFYTYPKDILPPLNGYILLTLDAPELTPSDKDYGLFLIDGTWKLSTVMYNSLSTPHLFHKRSLPAGFRTAYPRRQEGCSDPEKGLASVEALFASYYILGRNPEGLLDHYYWKQLFLSKNSSLII